MKRKLWISLFLIGMVITAISATQSVYAANKTHLNKQTVYLKVKKSYQLKLINNKKKIRWTTSNKKVAVVNNKGKVKALKKGICQIRASVGNQRYAATIDVAPVGLNAAYDVFLGKTETIHLNGTMDDASWQIADPNVATIDENGTITPIQLGTTTVTAVYQGVSYNAALNVYQLPKLNKKKLSLGDGETYQLSLKNNASNLTFKWKSGNKKVATVNAAGLVKAKKKGKTTITAYYGDQKLKCKLTVTNKVRINQKNVLLVPKEKKKFTLRHYKTLAKMVKTKKKNKKGKVEIKAKKVLPKIKWSTSNKKVATINSKGKLTAKNKAGKIKVIAKVGKKKYTIKMEVTKPVINDQNPNPFKTGEQHQLTLSDQRLAVTWSSGNEEMATVDQNGVLTAKSFGEVPVTITIGQYKATKNFRIIGRYHLEFNKNGDAMGSIASQDPYETDPITMPAGYTKPGYDQTSWNTSADGTGTSYAIGGTYSDLAASGTVTLYAIYTKKAAYVNIPVERAVDIVGLTGLGTSGTGEFKAATNRMASIDYIVPSQDMYFSIDDFIHYQIDYAQYDMNGQYVTKNGWRSHGLILTAGYKYRMSFRKPDDADFSANDISTVSSLIRYEVPDASKMQIVASQDGKSAHRGDNHNKYPENTTWAFEEAGKSSEYKYIETDIHNTADGQFAVIHDDTLSRTCARIVKVNGETKYMEDDRYVKDLTLKEIQEQDVIVKANAAPDENGYYDEDDVYNGADKTHPYLTVPSVEDYLKICHDSGKYCALEIKTISDPQYYQKLVDLIAKYDMQSKTILLSFHIGYLENIKNTTTGAQNIRIEPLFSSAVNADEVVLLEHFGSNADDFSIITD